MFKSMIQVFLLSAASVAGTVAAINAIDVVCDPVKKTKVKKRLTKIKDAFKD